MENPYTKTKEDEQWMGASMVPRQYKLRWLWFHHNRTLWMSTNRIHAHTHHPRDYILPILERYVRRFGYANEEFFRLAYERICERRGIGSGARWHYPDMDKFGVYPEGDYVPVYFEGEDCCPFCGSDNGYLIQTKVGESHDRELRRGDDKWRIGFLELSRFKTIHGEIIFKCLEKHCKEVLDFIHGKHRMDEQAKKMGVARKLPRKEMKASLSPNESFLRATAAMINFESRVIEKENKTSHNRSNTA